MGSMSTVHTVHRAVVSCPTRSCLYTRNLRRDAPANAAKSSFFYSKPFENSFRGGAELEPDTDAVAPGHPEIRRSVCIGTATKSQDKVLELLPV